MAHRAFKDSMGRQWDVWTVIPERAERRRKEAASPPEQDRRARADQEFRVPLGEQWTQGWLCFETSGEKRRLAPIPADWIEADDEQLERLCESASITTRPRRLAD